MQILERLLPHIDFLQILHILCSMTERCISSRVYVSSYWTLFQFLLRLWQFYIRLFFLFYWYLFFFLKFQQFLKILRTNRLWLCFFDSTILSSSPDFLKSFKLWILNLKKQFTSSSLKLKNFYFEISFLMVSISWEPASSMIKLPNMSLS